MKTKDVVKFTFLSFLLIFLSIFSALFVYKIIPYEVYAPKIDMSEIISLESGYSAEQYIIDQNNKIDMQIAELKSNNNPSKQGRLELIKRKRALVYSFFPWLMIFIFLKLDKNHLYIMITTLTASLFIGLIFWFELIVYSMTLVSTFWIRKLYENQTKG